MHLGFLTDVHANEAALAAIEKTAQDVDAWWFLGDAVGYGPQPVEAMQFLRGKVKDDHWLIGNHEVMLMQLLDMPNDRIGRVFEDVFNEGAIESLRNHLSVLKQDKELWSWCQTAWQGKIAQVRQETTDSANAYLVHGGLPLNGSDQQQHPLINNYVFPWKRNGGVNYSQEMLRQIPDANDAKTAILFHGHTHVPYARGIDRRDGLEKLLPIRYDGLEPILLNDYIKIVICPGSAGQPRNPDPDSHAAYGVWDTHLNTFSFRKVVYDTEKVIAQMNALGYPGNMKYYLTGAYPENPHRHGPIWPEWGKLYRQVSWGWEPRS